MIRAIDADSRIRPGLRPAPGLDRHVERDQLELFRLSTIECR